MLRIALIDEHELVRIGLKTVFKQDDSIVVVDDVPWDAASRMLGFQKPDLVLVDVPRAKPVPDTLEALCACHPDVKVVLMSALFDLDCLLQTLCGNVAGYLLKSASPEELLTAVRAIACGGVYIHSKLLESLPKKILNDYQAAGQRMQQGLPPLSEREQEVLELLVRGHTNREVSERLYLSPKTVEAYRARLYSKLGAKSRADLVAYASERACALA
jgi:two-component system response regulator NreC